MSDTADTLAKAVELLSNTASALLKQCDSLLDQASHEDLLAAVPKRLSEDASKRSSYAIQIPSQSVAAPIASTTSSAVLAGTERGDGSLIHQSNPSTDRRPQVRSSPKVVIPKPNHTHQPLRCVQICRRKVSQLQSRAVTESWEDGEIESQSPSQEAVMEASSEDELLHDTPKPMKPAKPARISELKRPLKSARRASKVATSQVAGVEHIDWVFWIQADEVGYWRPLSDFPSVTQALFKRKFNTDYLQKSYHVTYFSRMLRNRESYLKRDICVGNITYASRNEASKWRIAKGDKEKTCDTCLRAGRFCARMVEVGNVVKLGFFPVPEAVRSKVGWKEMRYWVGEKEKKKKKEKERKV